MATFSRVSLKKLNQCHPYLQLIMHKTIKLYDFTILCGYRTKKQQNKAYTDSRSKLKYPKSKHNKKPSLAIDICPYPIDWADRERFYYLAGIIEGISYSMGIPIKWGGDWLGNNDFKNNTFDDLCHYELI